MANCETILSEIKAAGVSLWPGDNGKLCVLGVDRLTPEQVAYLKANKPAILAHLQARNANLLPDSTTCEDWRRRFCNTSRERTP